MPHFSPETNTALHFGQRISLKLTRCVSFGSIEYPHFGHSVFNDAMIFFRLIFRAMIFP
jgi:hypothetical protein